MDNTTRVMYQALADFSALRREVRQARRDLAKLRAEEAAGNAASSRNRSATQRAATNRAKASDDQTVSLRKAVEQLNRYTRRQGVAATAVRGTTDAIKAQNRALRTNATLLAAAADAATGYARSQRRSAPAARNNSRPTFVPDDDGRNTRPVVPPRPRAPQTAPMPAGMRPAPAVPTETASATNARTQAANALVRAYQALSKSAAAATIAEAALEAAQIRQRNASAQLNVAQARLAETRKRHLPGSSQLAAAELRVARAHQTLTAATSAVTRAQERFKREANGLTPVLRSAEGGANRLHRAFQKFGNWRPKLTPPFVALIPIIAGVIAAINPLIALFGAVGTAAFGLASNIASLSGAFVALPGILSAVVGGITSVIASMGGVGNVFKTYAAMQKATGQIGAGASGGGETAAERADRLADAEYNLAKAQRNVQKAQDNLNKARQRAIKDLQDLSEEVGRASLNEDRAIADLQLAREQYNNIMADPGSTRGDKMDAAVRIREAEEALNEVRRQNTENVQALAKAEREGIDGNEDVIEAREAVADAMRSERDAQRNLTKETVQAAPGVQAAATATDEYNKALAELSPSARAVVLALIALQGQWKDMRRELQEEFFSKFVNDMDLLPQIIRNISAFLRPAAGSMGRFVSNFLNLAASPEWSRDFATIGEENGKLLDLMGQGALFLVEAFKDLIIAAAPFTEWLVGGLVDGTKNFRDLVSNARETGALAAWLEKISGRLRVWGGIVGNIAATLFNYGAAASGFGDWLSQGFLETTENWRKASQAAREEGSPFKKFLEDIQPLLSNVNGLFGDLFGWLGREIMDPGNIDGANRIVTLLRDDLGPAISNFLDVLADSDIDEKLIEAISSIVDSLSELIEAGGGAAFETFADFVAGFFGAIADFLSGLEPGQADQLLSILGALAALSFIGKFTGITSMVGSLLSLVAQAPTLMNLFGAMKGANKTPTAVPTPGTVVGAPVGGVGGTAAGAGALGAGLTGLRAFFGWAGALTFGASPNTISDDKIQNDRDFNSQNKDDFWAQFWRNFWGGDSSGLKTQDEWKNQLDQPKTPFGTPISDPMASGQGQTPNPFSGTPQASKDSWSEVTRWWNEELPRFFSEMNTNFSEGWSGAGSWFDTNFNQPIRNWWGGLTIWWQEDLPRFFSEAGTNLENGWKTVGSWFDTNFAQPIRTWWGGLRLWWTEELPAFFSEIGTNFERGWKTVGSWFDTNFAQPVRTAWEGFSNGLKLGWGTFWAVLTGDTETATNNIGQIFSGIQNMFKEPINWVIRTVFNDGLRRLWNGIAKPFGWKQLDPIGEIGASAVAPPRAAGKMRMGFKKGGMLPGYNPGIDNHHFVDQNGMRLDLGGGEGILIPQAARQLGPEGIAEINRNAKAGRQVFKNGGVFGNVPPSSLGRPGPRMGGFGEVAGDLWDKFSSFFKAPADFVKNTINNGAFGIPGLNQTLGGAYNTDYGNLLKSVPRFAVEQMANFGATEAKGAKRKQDADMAGGGPAPANVMGWRAQWAAVKAAFPSAWKSSDYRPGSITVNGGQSYHGLGRAIDVTPSKAIFEWIKANYPNSRELIYTPMGNRQLQNGRETTWGAAVAAQHWDHVHWAMKDGGIVPKLYDKGGILGPDDIGINRTGKPESVLTYEESRGLKALVNAPGLMRSPTLSMPQGLVTATQAVPQIQDNSINIEHLTITNPTPEPISESIPRAIRRVGYMQSARTPG